MHAYTITLSYVASFSYKNISLSMLSDVKRDLFSATKFPAALKVRSLGTLVAVIHENFLESKLRYLYNLSRSLHHSSGCLFSKPSEIHTFVILS